MLKTSLGQATYPQRKTASVIDNRLERELHPVSSGMVTNDHNKVIRGASVGIVHFSCDIAWTPTPLSFRSCNYGTFTGWWPHSQWALCVHSCCMCYTSSMKKTLLQLSKRSVWITSTKTLHKFLCIASTRHCVFPACVLWSVDRN
jgi:hypothetical protein